jgi:myosin heavy subunit
MEKKVNINMGNRYLNQSGCLEVDGMNDEEEFKEVLKAMDCLGS